MYFIRKCPFLLIFFSFMCSDPKLVEFLKTKKTQAVKSSETDVKMEQEPVIAPVRLERKDDKGISDSSR